MAEEFEQKLLEIRRVARVVAGGRRFSFRAAVIIGNRKGSVGFGLAKGPDVSIAIEKAVRDAKKNLMIVPLSNGTIPHAVEAKYASAHVFLKPAVKGRGILAGGPVRVIVTLAGIERVSAKILSRTTNKVNNSRATIKALRALRQEKVRAPKSEEMHE